MSEELSALITQLRSYQPIGELPCPRALGFIIDYPRFIDTLENINAMIGLERIKQQITRQVKSFMVNYRRCGQPARGKKLHTLLFGPPGCGKTQLGRYLAELWTTSGCLPEPDGSPLFLPQNQQNMPGIVKVDSEKINLRQSLVVREVQLRQLQDQVRNTQTQIREIITSFNNVRKKVRAKRPEQEGYIQSKFQDLKRKIRVTLNENQPGEILPVTIPKTPGGKTPFGSILPEPTKPRSPAKFAVVTRGDLIGKYQGHTTDRVRTILQEHIGGVLMIDEAYDLVTSGQDDYGREILTEIINFMTAWPDKIIFIFAGYRKEMEETVLRIQPGLSRRFNWTLEITEYSSDELYRIFQLQLRKSGWQLSESDTEKTKEFFERNLSKFPFYGGDTERLCASVEDVYHENSWQLALDDSVPDDNFKDKFGIITFSIIEKAFQEYLSNSVKEKEYQQAEAQRERIQFLYT